MSPGDFFSAVYSKAIELGANDVQARLAAAQASEETGFGKHMVGNNAFGIKAGTTYTGPAVTASTEEEYNGNTVRENARFRAYDDFTQSVGDYLGVIQQNFPDAWSAPTFSEAVKGLQTGVYGAYATRAAYPNNITAIDNKYGSLQFAADPDNVPTPYGPNEQADLTGLPDDVVPVADPNFAPIDREFAYAANPQNVGVPEARPAVPGLLTAFDQAAPQQSTPFDSITQAKEPGEWGVINGVGPVYTPAFNQWADLASAAPVQAPMNVAQPGLLSEIAAPEQAAQAPEISQADISRAFFNPTAANNLDPAFTAGLMGPSNPVVPTAVETTSYTPGAAPQSADIASSRFSTPAKTSRIGQSIPGLLDTARINPLAAIDPSTNTQSFLGQPTDVSSMAAAYEAQRGPTSGLLSTDMDIQRGNVERQLQNPIAAPSGVLAGVQQPAIDNTITGSTTPGLLSPASMTVGSPTLSGGFNKGLISEQPINQVGFWDKLSPNIDINLSGNIVPAAPTEVAAPSVETVEVAEQPTVASVVDGPATTPAVEQQTQQNQQATTTTPSNTVAARTTPTQNKGLLSGILSKETAIGGLLGSMALGPAGGILGALAGRQIANNGGLSNMFGQSYGITPVGVGPQASYSVWGGGLAPGSQAIASDGQRITAMPGGLTAVTNSHGVTTAFDSTGKGYSVFGGNFDAETDADAEAA